MFSQISAVKGKQQAAICKKCLGNIEVAYEMKETNVKSEEVPFLKDQEMLELELELEEKKKRLDNKEIKDQKENRKEVKGGTMKAKPKKKVKTNQGSSNDFECSICLRKFTFKRNLKRHVDVVHEKKKNFKCSQCPKEFSENWLLKRHMTRFHNFINDGTLNPNRPTFK